MNTNTLSALIPPPVEPEQAHWNDISISKIMDNVGQIVVSVVANPVVVAKETT